MDYETLAMIVTEQAAEITRLRTLADGIVPKWAAARDEVDRLRADLAAARAVTRKVADLIYSEADDPLQDAIDMACAFLERPGLR